MDIFFRQLILGSADNTGVGAAVGREKIAIFLAEIGADIFTLVNNLQAPRSTMRLG